MFERTFWAATALRLKRTYCASTQGSAFRATLGFGPESLWDSGKSHVDARSAPSLAFVCLWNLELGTFNSPHQRRRRPHNGRLPMQITRSPSTINVILSRETFGRTYAHIGDVGVCIKMLHQAEP